jgi:Co/Zn/Cd efflux system component
MDECCAHKSHELERLARQRGQRRVLVIVLAINALMFVGEFGMGLLAGSAALMADSVDMLGDALVYGLSLYALDRGERWKAGAALAKGGFILLFGLGVLVQIGVKLATGIPPASGAMLVTAAIALAANLLCLSLLWRFRRQDVTWPPPSNARATTSSPMSACWPPPARWRSPARPGRTSWPPS